MIHNESRYPEIIAALKKESSRKCQKQFETAAGKTDAEVIFNAFGRIFEISFTDRIQRKRQTNGRTVRKHLIFRLDDVYFSTETIMKNFSKNTELISKVIDKGI